MPRIVAKADNLNELNANFAQARLLEPVFANFQGSLEHLKGGNVSIDEVINMLIFGIHGKAPSRAHF